MAWTAKAREAALLARRTKGKVKGGKGITKAYHGGGIIRGNVVKPGGFTKEKGVQRGLIYASQSIHLPRGVTPFSPVRQKVTPLFYAKQAGAGKGRIAILNVRHRKTLTTKDGLSQESKGSVQVRIGAMDKGTVRYLRINRQASVIGYVPRLKDFKSKAKRRA